MNPKHRDVLISLVQAAKDDLSSALKIAEDPNNYRARAIDLFRRELKVYSEIEEYLRTQ